MNQTFVKFPTTPHLLWTGSSAARDDKVLSTEEATAFLEKPVFVEEKVDGANLGLSFDSDGNLVAQNRGSILERSGKGQFATLWRWLLKRESRLFDILDDRLIVFGEWCYARHSIRYTRLPDLFLAFDLYDRSSGEFLNVENRDRIIKELELELVPRIGFGVFALESVPELIGQSNLYDGPMEGIYLRRENSAHLTERAKIVRSEFTQAITAHWSKQPLVQNVLLPRTE